MQKQLSTTLVTILADAREQERFTQFGSQVSATTQNVLTTGAIVRLLLNQTAGNRISPEGQVVLLALVLTTFSDGKTVEFFKEHRDALVEAVESKACTELRDRVRTESKFDTFLKALEDASTIFEQACHK